jgi:hypothetical protein
LPLRAIEALFEGGGVTVVSPERRTRSPATPGGFRWVVAWMVLLVNADAGVKVGPEVTVSVPPDEEVAVAASAETAATSERKLRFFISVEVMMCRV